MEVRRVDPRDTEWEEDFPTYRVYFFTDPGPGLHGWTSDEFEIREAPDVRAVIEWQTRRPPVARTSCMPWCVRHTRRAAAFSRSWGTTPTDPETHGNPTNRGSQAACPGSASRMSVDQTQPTRRHQS